jgi:hypothetical protein
MVISHKYKFIFIKTRKTAGTSLEVFLSGICGDDDILTPIYPEEEGHVARNHDGFFNHMSARRIKTAVGPSVWDSYFKFCVERNPWDKVLSSFHWSASHMDFDEFLSGPGLPVDHEMYLDEEGRMMVDKVVRYENLDEELSGLFSRFGLRFVRLNHNAKSQSRKDRRHYREAYDSRQAEAVSKSFSKEIELFGYAF